MKSNPDELIADDPRVMQAARDYLADVEAGRQPDRRAYFARIPELQEALAECFDGIDLAHGAGLALRPAPAMMVEEAASMPLGDFQIVREIGRGGMGIVYEAIQLSLGRRVALKVLPFAAALDAKHLQRFKTEAHAAAQLHHTSIVPVYAVGCERGMHFYAMQLIEGRPLDQVIREQRGEREATGAELTLDFRAAGTVASTPAQTAVVRSSRTRENFRTAARMAAQIAEALEYAHDVGVVHRDIKPANLLVDARGNIWVTDFGLAQVTADVGLTQTGDIFGTLRYMSPEQASGRRAQVDQRTDVYSLGATLYEYLTLEPLFASQDRQTLLNQILNEEPRSLRQIDRSSPVELETIVLKSLAKLPEERYASAGEMAADLRRFLDERPILARRPSLVDRSRKWLRRHPSVVGTSLVLLVFCVVALAVNNALVAREKGRTEDALKREAASVVLIADEQSRTQEALYGERQKFELARRAADDMIRMAETELADQPHLQNLRKGLLETALAYYQQFIELRQQDPDAQIELAATRDKVKRILADLTIMEGAGQFQLLNSPSVLDDLRLTGDQRKRVVELTQRLEAQRQESFRDFYRLSNDERNRRFVELARTSEAGLSEILGKESKRRLGQVALQFKGLLAFHDPTVVKELNLSIEQRSQIRVIEAEFNFGRFAGPKSGLSPGGPGKKDPEWKNPKDLEPKEPDWRRLGAFEKIEKILTAEQRTKWKEMMGEPVKGGIRLGPMGPFGPPPPP